MDIDFHHLSGKHNRKAGLLADAIQFSIDQAASVIGLTEVNEKYRGDVLHFKGYATIRGANGWRGESALLINQAEWRVVRIVFQVVDRNLIGARKAQIAAIAVIEHIVTKVRLVVSALHAPSAVESAYRAIKKLTKREKEHSRGLDAWGDRIQGLADSFGAVGAVGMADFNINLKIKWLRRMVSNRLGGDLRIRYTPPDAPTIGKRRHIDGFATTSGLKVLRVRVLPKMPASDHRGVCGTIRIPVPKEPAEAPRETEPVSSNSRVAKINGLLDQVDLLAKQAIGEGRGRHVKRLRRDLKSIRKYLPNK